MVGATGFGPDLQKVEIFGIYLRPRQVRYQTALRPDDIRQSLRVGLDGDNRDGFTVSVQIRDEVSLA